MFGVKAAAQNKQENPNLTVLILSVGTKLAAAT